MSRKRKIVEWPVPVAPCGGCKAWIPSNIGTHRYQLGWCGRKPYTLKENGSPDGWPTMPEDEDMPNCPLRAPIEPQPELRGDRWLGDRWAFNKMFCAWPKAFEPRKSYPEQRDGQAVPAGGAP